MDELLKDVLGDLKAGRIDEAEALARVKRVIKLQQQQEKQATPSRLGGIGMKGSSCI